MPSLDNPENGWIIIWLDFFENDVKIVVINPTSCLVLSWSLKLLDLYDIHCVDKYLLISSFVFWSSEKNLCGMRMSKWCQNVIF